MGAGSNTGGASPFRGLLPYDETGASLFFGRASETSALFQLVTHEGARVTALTAAAGMGKTSLLRAGLAPRLARQGIGALYLGSYLSLDQSLWQAATRLQAEPPAAGEASGDYLARLALASPGILVILDHLEDLLADGSEADGSRWTSLVNLVGSAAARARERLRFVLCTTTATFPRLDRFARDAGLAVVPGRWLELPPLDGPRVAEIFEQTALQTGTFFDAGLAQVIATDLCRRGPVSPLELQVLARVVAEKRLTSLRRYERSGGSDILIHQFFRDITEEAGGAVARRLLLSLTGGEAMRAEEIAARVGLSRVRVESILATFTSQGLVRKHDGAASGNYSLIHPGLVPLIDGFAATDRSESRGARRLLRQRVLAGGRLSVGDLRRVRKHLSRGELSAEESLTIGRSRRRTALHLAVALLVGGSILVGLYARMRSSYTLDQMPPQDPASARIVVRLGRPSLSLWHLLPNRPPFGSILADTGFSAAAMASDLSHRIVNGTAVGALDRDRHVPVPGWLRTVLDGLRPVPRGLALVLMGDSSGVLSLKQAFADPPSRGEVLEALAVVGRGQAGEDEILGAALSDSSPEIRRRGVEVAAAIDRQLQRGTHGATLRTALADQAFEVKAVVLRETQTLAPGEAAGILAVALADRDPAFRHLAERAVLELAARSPAAAAEAVRPSVRGKDPQARRTGLGLLEQIAGLAPADVATTLTQLLTDEQAPEEARISALVYLRRTGVPLEKLKPVLEQAVNGTASPRLRAAALPLFARLVEPDQAEEMAIAESKGSSRAAGAAIWGAVAMRQPDSASKALKGFLYDPSVEARTEAARSFGFLKRDGLGLVQKALLDPSAEVERAAIESAVMLAPQQPAAVAEALGHAFLNVRPVTRRTIVEALGHIGQDRPLYVLPPLAKALKEGDSGTRAAAAATICALARKNAAAAAPYLRIAARDTDRDVRTAAASCLGNLVEGDPRGAAHIAADLATADEPAVRAAAARSLGTLAPKARDLVLPPLVRLLQDPDRTVRVTAVMALQSVPGAAKADGKGSARRSDEMERALGVYLAQGDEEERKLVVAVAAQAHLVPLLRQAATDGDDLVRLDAVRAAGALEPSLVEILRAAVEDRAVMVRAEAIRRLAGTSGEGAGEVLPIFQTMLRSGDPATRLAGVVALGDLASASGAATALLERVLGQPGEAVRTAATEALGRIAARDPTRAAPLLEKALADRAHDVRSTAIRGLGAVWAHQMTAAELAHRLEIAETDSARRFVALEALVLQASGGVADTDRRAAAAALDQVAESGPPLARLAARVGRAFLLARPAEMHAFWEKLFAG